MLRADPASPARPCPRRYRTRRRADPAEPSARLPAWRPASSRSWSAGGVPDVRVGTSAGPHASREAQPGFTPLAARVGCTSELLARQSVEQAKPCADVDLGSLVSQSPPTIRLGTTRRATSAAAVVQPQGGITRTPPRHGVHRRRSAALGADEPQRRSARNFDITAATRSGCSRCGTCPTPASTSICVGPPQRRPIVSG